MRNLLLFPFRIAVITVKGLVLAAALILMAVLLVPQLTAAEELQPCAACTVLQDENASLREEIDRLTTELNAEHLIRRRIDIRFLPELGLEWLEIHTVSFWDEVSPRCCRQSAEEPRVVIWFSTFAECALTTIDHSCSA